MCLDEGTSFLFGILWPFQSLNFFFFWTSSVTWRLAHLVSFISLKSAFIFSIYYPFFFCFFLGEFLNLIFQLIHSFFGCIHWIFTLFCFLFKKIFFIYLLGLFFILISHYQNLHFFLSKFVGFILDSDGLMQPSLLFSSEPVASLSYHFTWAYKLMYLVVWALLSDGMYWEELRPSPLAMLGIQREGRR